MRRATFTRVARFEMLEAQDWYDSQKSGLGSQFRAEVNDAVDRILDNALQFPIVHKQYRRALLERFPYSLIFGIRADRSIGIFACVHSSRDPMRWQSRV